MTTESNAHIKSKAFFTPEELAEFLSVSKATIYRLVGKRKLPFHRIGGMLRFKRQEIENYLENERIDPVKY
jgi:excisionase family DNA binding protein